MHIDIIAVHPQIIESAFATSIMKKAIGKKIASVNIHNLRDYATNAHKTIDDYAFGGGAGMVLTIEPIDRCITALKSKRAYDEIIYMSPDGESLQQMLINQLVTKESFILLCGHYKGVDERVREHLITKEISIGDYVISGGELAAAVLADSIIRLLPGAMSDETSALTDSFQDGLVAPPVYTRPSTYKGWKTPDILLSGHERKINEWRHQKAFERTHLRRPRQMKDDKNQQ